MEPERYLPYSRQSVDEADIAAVARVLRSDFLTTGPEGGAFEAAFAEAVGARHAVSCSSGTAALHLAALALGLGPGDVVIVPSLTFLASANMARYVGAELRFADVDPDTGLMTPATLRDALAAAVTNVKAVVPVHLNGQCCDMPALRAVVEGRNVALVEDACHALGGADVGACAASEMAMFSLHPAKVIAAGEGGVVTTRDPALAERLARFRNHGMVRDPARFACPDQAFDKSGGANPWYYEMPEIGFNYRLSDIHAALAHSQIARMASFVAARRRIAARYDAALAGLAPLVRPVGRIAGEEPAWHLYVVLIEFDRLKIDRATLMRRLREANIGTQVHYLPVHRQPYYRARYGAVVLPGADAYYSRALSLPLFPDMTDDDTDRVVRALSAIVASSR